VKKWYLECDVCRGRIDDLANAMMFWDTEDAGNDVTELLVAHKHCDRPSGHVDRLGLSVELENFGKPAAALREAWRMADTYCFNGSQSLKLLEVALLASSRVKRRTL
jgi:hypothetical protein